jgi:hypothetical protein
VPPASSERPLTKYCSEAGCPVLGFDIREPSCDWTGNAFEFCDVCNVTRLTELISRFRQSYPTVFLLQPRETVAQCRRYDKPVRVSTRRKSQPRGRNRLLQREYGPVASADLAVYETHPLCPPHPCGVSEVGQDPLVAQYFTNYAIPSSRIRIFNTTGLGKIGPHHEGRGN